MLNMLGAEATNLKDSCIYELVCPNCSWTLKGKPFWKKTCIFCRKVGNAKAAALFYDRIPEIYQQYAEEVFKKLWQKTFEQIIEWTKDGMVFLKRSEKPYVWWHNEWYVLWRLNLWRTIESMPNEDWVIINSIKATQSCMRDELHRIISLYYNKEKIRKTYDPEKYKHQKSPSAKISEEDKESVAKTQVVSLIKIFLEKYCEAIDKSFNFDLSDEEMNSASERMLEMSECWIWSLEAEMFLEKWATLSEQTAKWILSRCKKRGIKPLSNKDDWKFWITFSSPSKHPFCDLLCERPL